MAKRMQTPPHPRLACSCDACDGAPDRVEAKSKVVRPILVAKGDGITRPSVRPRVDGSRAASRGAVLKSGTRAAADSSGKPCEWGLLLRRETKQVDRPQGRPLYRWLG